MNIEVCQKDGAMLREDTDFLRAALHDGLTVRRYVGVCGHSVYDPPTIEGRGWTPRANPDRACSRCGEDIPGTSKGDGHGPKLHESCKAHARRDNRCTNCGLPVTPPRLTCSDTCLVARIKTGLRKGRRPKTEGRTTTR